VLAKAETGAWYDYGTVWIDPLTYYFEMLAGERKVEYEQCDYSTFKKLNELVEPKAAAVRETALQIASQYSGEYNVYQLCALFDWVKEEIGYVSDPRGMEYWSPPGETLRAKGGDCEDHAILLSSMIEAIGGASRLVLTEDHALASVYIGDKSHADKVLEAIEDYYGAELPFAFWVENGDRWLVLESTGGLYPGDLPVGAKRTSEGWTFSRSEFVHFADIIPE